MAEPGGLGRTATVTAAVAAQVTATPERVALVVGERRYRYAELWRRAGQVAMALRAGGVRPGQLVGVCLPRTAWLVPVLLGVWRAGCGYVPLDPTYPASRLRFMATDAGLTHLVTAAGAAPAELAPGVPVLRVDDLDQTPGDLDLDPIAGHPSTVAYLLYTSGSTGQPKGVPIEHRNVMAFLRWTAAAYTADELAGCLAAASICFDFSVLELYTPLVTGGTVILAENLLALPTLAARSEVRMVCAVPSALAVLLDVGLPPGVRTVNVGGEALTGALRDRLYAQPQVHRVVHLYGPTEGATACLGYEVPASAPGEPPLGQPIAGAELAIREPGNGQPVPDGAVGELWLAGPGVTPGYHQRPELTAERFVERDGRRWYRTGDLMRIVDGQYRYAGRIDDQVKVRGHRVELGEVAANLQAHPAVRSATVLAPADQFGTRRLVGYVAADPALTEAELRRHLADRLPGYLVPDRIAVLDRLPVAGSGKVDRDALLAVQLPTVETAPPADPVLARLAAIAAELLELPAVAVDAPLTEYGCHSLAATRICHRAGAAFGVVIPVAAWLAEPTVTALAALVANGARASPPGGTASPDRHPLTRMQRDLWTLRQVTGNPAVTLVAVRLGLTGSDPTAVPPALAAVAARHPALRTQVADSGGAPVALLAASPAVPVVTHDLRGRPPIEQRERAEALARAAARRPFDLNAGQSLVRADLIVLADDRAELVLVADHLILDGWSVGVILADLAAALAGQPIAESPAVTLADVAAAETTPDSPGEPAPAGLAPDDLPGRARIGPPRGSGDRITHRLDPRLPAAVAGVAARYGATPFTVYAAALAVLLDCLRSQPEVLLGVVAADRDRPGLEQVVGPLLRVLPVRVDLTDDPPFGVLLRRVGAATATALLHDGASTGGGRPGSMLPVVLSVQPETAPVQVTAGQVTVRLLGELATGAAQSDLAVFVNTTAAGTELQVEYADDRFDAAGMIALAARLVRLVEQAVADPTRPVSGLDGLDLAERSRLLALAAGEPLRHPPPATVLAAVLQRAAAQPAAPAVSGADGGYDYAGLVAAATRIGAGLVARGVRPGDLVAACLPRDHQLPAALLGIWRAGAAYLPLEPSLPARRRQALAAAAGVRLTVTTVDTDGSPAPVRLADLLATAPPVEPLPDADPAGQAYVLFTSGSTGTPKGVEVTQANLAWFVAATQQDVDLGPDDVALGVTPVTSDISCFDLWAVLAAGGSTVFVGRDQAVDGGWLAERMAKAGVNLLDVTPTQLRVLLAGGWQGHPAMRVVSGGEALDATLAAELLSRAGTVWNAYGPTEATVTATSHRLAGPPSDPVPLGRPVPGVHTYVLDRCGRLVPPGVTGELWVGGGGVARGYHGDPDRTAAAFVRDPYRPGQRCYRTGDMVRWRPDGLLEFAGRRDHQVKLHGYRIELGEIEAALRAVHGVADAAVTVRSAAGGQAFLVGHLAPRGGPLDLAAVEAELRAVLPAHQVPRRWTSWPVLPRTTSGKVDRSALAAAPLGTSPARAPASDVERYLQQLWSQLLGQPVTVDDDFFGAGGDSIAATRVAARLTSDLGVELGARLLFEHPVLADFAVVLERLALAALDEADEEPR